MQQYAIARVVHETKWEMRSERTGWESVRSVPGEENMAIKGNWKSEGQFGSLG